MDSSSLTQQLGHAREATEDAPPAGVILQKLSVRHKQAMALLAQGVDRASIAQVCNYTPEYITWLTRQPTCRTYLREMSEHVGIRLDAMFDKSVDVIAEALQSGNTEERLKAARLQMEATKRLGRGAGQDDGAGGEDDRLEVLAGRLVKLLQRSRQEVTLDGEATEVFDVPSEPPPIDPDIVPDGHGLQVPG